MCSVTKKFWRFLRWRTRGRRGKDNETSPGQPRETETSREKESNNYNKHQSKPFCEEKRKFPYKGGRNGASPVKRESNVLEKKREGEPGESD